MRKKLIKVSSLIMIPVLAVMAINLYLSMNKTKPAVVVDFQTSTPEEQGMDSAKLTEMFNVIKKDQLNIHSILIARNGRLVTEAYFNPYNKDTKHEIHSCTKSVVSALVGIAIEKEIIKGVDQKVVDFFTDKKIANLDARKKAATIENLLTLTSGFHWGQEDEKFFEQSDWVQYELNKAMDAEPGKQFKYNSLDPHLLSAIIQKETGKKTFAFAKKYLFEPLNIKDVYWSPEPKGINAGGGGIMMTPRDMVKFGELYLNKGAVE